MKRPAVSYPYRRSFLDDVMIHKGLHFSCSRPFQNAVKVRTRRVRRAAGKRICREAMQEA